MITNYLPKMTSQAAMAALCVFSFSSALHAQLSPDLLGLAAPAPSAGTNGGDGGREPAAGARPTGTSVRILVQFKSTPTASDLTSFQSVTGTKGTPLGDGIIATVPVSSLDSLDQVTNLTYASPDRSVVGTLEFAASAMGATNVWPAASGGVTPTGFTGSGVGVAIVDSGYYAHADFGNDNCTSTRVVYKESFITGDKTTDDPYGHGTHVAGIIAGNHKCAAETKALRGIAPQARLIVLRVLDAEGRGTDSAVIAAIDRAIALRTTHNIKVLNLSLGRPILEECAKDPLCKAVTRAWRAGITVVVSAGNYGRYPDTKGYATIASPGNNPFAITVGAMRHDYSYDRALHEIATYSSKGPSIYDHYLKPDLVATGNRIAAAKSPNSTLSKSSTWANSNFMELSGTSMAAPMVAGAVALMAQKSPTLSPDSIKARLMKSAWKGLPFDASYTDTATGIVYANKHDVFTVGAGYLDIPKALAATDVVASTKSARSPVVSYNAATKVVSIASGNSIVWGDSAFAKSIVWGDSMVWGDSILNGNSLVWGDSLTNGFSMVWGDSIVWGDASTLAASVPGKGDAGPKSR